MTENLDTRKQFEEAMRADGWGEIPAADFEGTVITWWHGTRLVTVLQTRSPATTGGRRAERRRRSDFGGHMIRRIKYLIADLLNLRDDVCWSEAVLWSEFGTRTIGDLIGSAEGDCKDDGLCYCGKFCDGRRSVPADFELE